MFWRSTSSSLKSPSLAILFLKLPISNFFFLPPISYFSTSEFVSILYDCLLLKLSFYESLLIMLTMLWFILILPPLAGPNTIDFLNLVGCSPSILVKPGSVDYFLDVIPKSGWLPFIYFLRFLNLFSFVKVSYEVLLWFESELFSTKLYS